MKRVRLIIVALAVAGCGGSTVVIETVDAGTASALVVQQGTVVLDLRTPDEFASGHITGAVNIDFYATDFADQIGALDRGARYVVYCRSGNRSGEAMDLFRRRDNHPNGGNPVAAQREVVAACLRIGLDGGGRSLSPLE